LAVMFQKCVSWIRIPNIFGTCSREFVDSRPVELPDKTYEYIPDSLKSELVQNNVLHPVRPVLSTNVDGVSGGVCEHGRAQMTVEREGNRDSRAWR